MIDGFVAKRKAGLLARVLARRNLPPNLLWMPCEGLDDAALRAAFDRHVGLQLAELVADVGRALVSEAKLRYPRLAVAGFEIWSGVTRPGDASGFLHRDLDEGRKLAFGLQRFPLASAIVHLGPEGLVGGQTLVWAGAHVPAPLEAVMYSKVKVEQLLQTHEPWHAVAQRPGRLILFDGALPHVVAPVLVQPGATPRVALLVNAWDQPLHASAGRFGRLSAKGFQALTQLEVPALQQLVNAASAMGFKRSIEALRAVRVLTGAA